MAFFNEEVFHFCFKMWHERGAARHRCQVLFFRYARLKGHFSGGVVSCTAAPQPSLPPVSHTQRDTTAVTRRLQNNWHRCLEQSYRVTQKQTPAAHHSARKHPRSPFQKVRVKPRGCSTQDAADKRDNRDILTRDGDPRPHM